ncbi:glutaminyl-tRNA synthetase [Sistotremastrum niveocremeum HHB9708]|uniref:glutamine--tRNA ligase n=1 Tax=Sistotremastrum niveocremeum HHB9708 TaxID=1314777 RepID=A0A164P496_9AGAM|nr:glutaminyl-tRNA synthetase [Sistotremastrum niveocremeum HHB9708]
MPPKFDPTDPETSALISLFQTIGLSGPKATDAARNPKNAASLKELIEQNDLKESGLTEKDGALIAGLAVSGAKLGLAERSYAARAIVDGRLKTTDQVTAAIKYLQSHEVPIQDEEFDAECGVGFTITSEEIDALVKQYAESANVSGWPDLSRFLGGLRTSGNLKWANPLEVKTAAEARFLELFGPKDTSKPAKPTKAPKEPKASTVNNEATTSTPIPEAATSVFDEGFLGKLHKPGENPQIDPKLREQHLKVTGGKVFTRFPPEPNGYLHIGHSKAIFVDFGYAAHHGGHCYLRYDDTNPEKEEKRYFDSILETVRWLGYEPWKITYSSDYFQQLYDLAVELIRRDKGYVCSCTADEIQRNRGDKGGARIACVHRTRPVEESLREFEKMRDGHYRPGDCILRMKQDLEDGNPQMWDLPAYRILDAPHHRTGTKWKIYPLYDFAHCLVDSMENITHSLCTVEFIQSRTSYEWLCDAVGVYKPRQREFGRLSLQSTIMSKRKLAQLVDEGHVMDWDDPRLYTLVALRRRGVPPAAINSFVSGLGVSTAITNIQSARFDQSVREDLEKSASRLLMVLQPLKVTIENLPEDFVQTLEKPLHPKNAALGTSTIPFTRHLYIDRDDFRLEDSKDYFRLAPGKTVGLFSAPHPISYVAHKTDPATGEVTEVIVKLEDGTSGPVKKPKAFIQWVAVHAPSGSPVIVDETRIFYPLFKSDNPLAAKPDWKADISPHSMDIVKGAMVEIGFWKLAKQAFNQARLESQARTEKALREEDTSRGKDDDTPKVTSEQLVGKECVRFQGLRVAYFALDKDAKVASVDEAEDVVPGRRDGDFLVLNRIVTLKEDASKNG